MARPVKIILAASDIPLGRTVTKKTGTKEYVLLDKLRVFGENGERREIKALPGALFLVCDGDANAIPSSTELLWVTTDLDYADHVRRSYMEDK